MTETQQFLLSCERYIRKQGFKSSFVARMTGVKLSRFRKFRSGVEFPTLPEIMNLSALCNVSWAGIFWEGMSEGEVIQGCDGE